MKTAKVYTKNTSWTTSINGTDKEIQDYFINQWFNVGVYPVEKMEQVLKVKILIEEV